MSKLTRLYSQAPERIKPLLKGFYLTLTSNKSNPQKAIREYKSPNAPKQDLQKLLDISDPVIIESGANDGTNTGIYLRMFEKPTIHAIEPVPRLFQDLQSRFSYDENVILHNKALGEQKGQIEMNVYEDGGSSSVFESNNAHEQYGGEAKTKRQATITTQQTTIDDITDDADIISLDMQGYELNALKGAEKNLQNCKAVFTEVSFIPLYDGQPLFCDISMFLSNHNFHIYDLYIDWKGNNGEIAHCDAIFLNESVYQGSDFDVNPFDLK